MKFILILTALILLSCSPQQARVYDEDYVLIEFAAKLEEDYHKIQNIPYEPDFKTEKTDDPSDDGQFDDHHHGHYK